MRLLKWTFENSYETRMGLALLVWREDFGQTPTVVNQEWVWRFLVVLAFLDLRLLKWTYKNSYETRMGLALLVWREAFGQTPKVINKVWVWRFFVVSAFDDLRLLKWTTVLRAHVKQEWAWRFLFGEKTLVRLQKWLTKDGCDASLLFQLSKMWDY